MSEEPFDLLDDRPPRSVMDDIEQNTRSIDDQAGNILNELYSLSAQFESRLADIKSMMDWQHGFLSNINSTLHTIKLTLFYIAAALTFIALR